MPLAKIEVDWDGGPYCSHNMPCAVCDVRHAVRAMGIGVFLPCWKCQEGGWEMRNKQSADARAKRRLVLVQGFCAGVAAGCVGVTALALLARVLS